jgi:hypothetical protein
MARDTEVSLTKLKFLAEQLFEMFRETEPPRLQILVQRFDSASGLQGKPAPISPGALIPGSSVGRASGC